MNISMVLLRRYIFMYALTMVGIFAMVQFALATEVETTQVGSFIDAEEVRLFKHHGRLYAFVEKADDDVAMYIADRSGDDWTELNNNVDSIADLMSNTKAISRLTNYKHYLYAATVNKDGVAELWRIPKAGGPAVWKQVGESGFGDSANTDVIGFMRKGGKMLYVVTENANGDGLFGSEQGSSWEQVGEYGLGMNLTDLSAVENTPFNQLLLVGTSGGKVYQAAPNDLTSWFEVASLTDPVTAIQRHLIAVSNDAGAMVYQLGSDGTTTAVGEVGLGNVNNTAVVGFRHVGTRAFALLTNAVDGAEIRELNLYSGAWDAVATGGFSNPNNTSLWHLTPYRGARYFVTVNQADGPEAFRLKNEL